MEQRTIHPGCVYRYFKGNFYYVEGTAKDSETQQEMVVYRQLYGDHSLWVRPLEMFLSKVDHDKYPDIQQEYRFECIEDLSEYENQK